MFSLLFRLAHNTKGSSQSVGLKVFGSFVHEVENLIKGLRDSTIPKESVLNWPEFLLESQSILTTWLEGSANGSILPEHKFPRADEHVLKIQALLKVSEVSSTPASVEGDIVFDMDVLTAHKVKSPEIIPQPKPEAKPAASAAATASSAKPIETSLKLQPKDMELH